MDLDRSEGEFYDSFIEDDEFDDEPRIPSPDYELGEISGDFRDAFDYGKFEILKNAELIKAKY